ncbi:MAG: hypothetical protein CMN87_16560 [Stappia sp.]|uniref:heme-dependent oxidative N-demethylase family protein n=1 Tax=Stappia sp. TaxID=1870903 RepID=UPI000C46D024|nr:DUF3445 domain-containing protein [Stappia sp.]MBM21618.1 hypothetical protein [Stappia sp.]
MSAGRKGDAGNAQDATVRAPFAHTPYDGSARPFAVGLVPLDLAEWIEHDARFADDLARKEELLAGGGAPVLMSEDGTRAAQQEVLDLLADHLPQRFPDIYAREGERITVRPTGTVVDRLAPGPVPFAAAARLVQEDLVLMRKGGDGYRIAAAALCFPSSWSLAEKFGKAMPEIHEGVPGFNDTRMGAMVARIFDNLPVDRPSWRLNWSLYPGPELHNPRPRIIDPDRLDSDRLASGRLAGEREAGTEASALHVRVERQTLRRLPASGDILFTIRVHHDPVAAFADHPRGRELARGLRVQLLALDEAQAAYKGLTTVRPHIADLLQRLADTAGGDSP